MSGASDFLIFNAQRSYNTLIEFYSNFIQRGYKLEIDYYLIIAKIWKFSIDELYGTYYVNGYIMTIL